jgi:hypothetical protein
VRGRPDEAEQVLSEAAARGHWYVREPLIALLSRQGRDAEADRIVVGALAAGEPGAVELLAQRWRQQGRTIVADDLVRYGLQPDGTVARPWWP